MRFTLLGLVAVLQGSSAFTALPPKRFVDATRTCFVGPSSLPNTRNTQLNILPPEMADTNAIHTVSTHLADLFQASSTILADAATAAAASSDGGWWNSYLNIFKTGLIFMHDIIDQPLRSAGIEQTWGFAIALFTASKY